MLVSRTFALITSLASVACAHSALAPETVRSQILDLELQRQQAQLRGDWQTIQKLNAQDFYEIGGNGAVRTGAQNSEAMRSGTLKFDKVDYSDQQVRIYGDVVILNGIGHRTGSFGGAAFKQEFRYTRIYVRDHDSWSVVFAQNTRIEPPTP